MTRCAGGRGTGLARMVAGTQESPDAARSVCAVAGCLQSRRSLWFFTRPMTCCTRARPLRWATLCSSRPGECGGVGEGTCRDGQEWHRGPSVGAEAMGSSRDGPAVERSRARGPSRTDRGASSRPKRRNRASSPTSATSACSPRRSAPRGKNSERSASRHPLGPGRRLPGLDEELDRVEGRIGCPHEPSAGSRRRCRVTVTAAAPSAVS